MKLAGLEVRPWQVTCSRDAAHQVLKSISSAPMPALNGSSSSRGSGSSDMKWEEEGSANSRQQSHRL